MRVLLIGDGCALTTGFAQVLRHVAAALVARGDRVGQITSLDLPPFCRSEPYRELGVEPFFPTTQDAVGFSILGDVLRRFAPERVFINCDPGMANGWISRLQAHGTEAPILLYSPVEGAPVARTFLDAFDARNSRTVLYTRWSADRVESACGRRYPWVYHGVDPVSFHPLSPAEREEMRERLGWAGRFVVAYVARNCARKGQNVLIEAMAQIRRNCPQALLYLHCAPFDNYWGQGWDLRWLAERAGVSDAVVFPGDLAHAYDAVHGLGELSFMQRLAAADLYVHPAQVEGFGLPIIEAMACGLPVAIAGDQGNMQEIAGDAPLGTVAAAFFDTWFTGARLAVTLPDAWAPAIHWAAGHPDECAAAAERSLVRARDFSWETMTHALLAELDASPDSVLTTATEALSAEVLR